MALINPLTFNDYADPQLLAQQTAKFVGIQENPSTGQNYIPVVYGYRRVEGIRMLTSVLSSNTNILYCVYALSEGRCGQVRKVFVDGVEVTLSTPGYLDHKRKQTIATGPYAGILEVEYLDGQSGTTDWVRSDLLKELVGITNVYEGNVNLIPHYPDVSILVCKFIYNDPSPYKSIPKVSVEMFGRDLGILYSGQDAAAADYNPACVIRDLIVNSRYGRGISSSKIDADSFGLVAQACDAARQITPTLSSKQWTTNWIMDTSRSILENIKQLLQIYKMALTFSNGKFYLSIESSPSDSTVGGALTITEADIIGSVSIKYPGASQRYNKVYVEYINPESGFQTRVEQFPSDDDTTFLTEDGGIPLETKITANALTSYAQANDLAQMTLRRSRGQAVYSFRATKALHQVRVGDKIILATTYPYIDNQAVVVISMKMNSDYTFDMTCVQYSSGFYPGSFSNTISTPSRGIAIGPSAVGIITPPGTRTSLGVLPPEKPPEPSYTLSNPSSINEGQTLTITINSTGVVNGTTVYWEIKATDSIVAADFTTAMTGTATINSNTATVSIDVSADTATEGSERLEFILKNSTGDILAQTSVVILDTSTGAQVSKQVWFTDSNMTQLDDNPLYYLGFLTTANVRAETESLSTYGDQGVSLRVTVPDTVKKYCQMELHIGLVDREQNNLTKTRNIYWTWSWAGIAPLYLIQDRSTTGQITTWEYDPENRPYATKPLNLRQIGPSVAEGPVITSKNYPKLFRLRQGYYTSSGFPLKFLPAVGTNITKSSGTGFANYISNINDSSAMTIKFFEIDSLNQVVYIGKKTITIGVEQKYMGSKYLSSSKTNYTTGTGQTMPT